MAEKRPNLIKLKSSYTHDDVEIVNTMDDICQMISDDQYKTLAMVMDGVEDDGFNAGMIAGMDIGSDASEAKGEITGLLIGITVGCMMTIGGTILYLGYKKSKKDKPKKKKE